MFVYVEREREGGREISRASESVRESFGNTCLCLLCWGDRQENHLVFHFENPAFLSN